MVYTPFRVRNDGESRLNAPIAASGATDGGGILSGKWGSRVANATGSAAANMMGIPGSTAGGLISDGLQGKFDGVRTAKNIAKDAMTIGAGMPGQIVSPVVNFAGALLSGEPLKTAGTKAGVGSLISLGAGAVGGLPGMLAGIALGELASSSFRDGMLGDMADTRNNEKARDTLEDSGYSSKDAKSISQDINSWERRGIGAPIGLSTISSKSGLGGMVVDSFKDYGDGGGHNVGGERGSSTGTGGGYNDGKGGVSGL